MVLRNVSADRARTVPPRRRSWPVETRLDDGLPTTSPSASVPEPYLVIAWPFVMTRPVSESVNSFVSQIEELVVMTLRAVETLAATASVEVPAICRTLVAAPRDE